MAPELKLTFENTVAFAGPVHDTEIANLRNGAERSTVPKGNSEAPSEEPQATPCGSGGVITIIRKSNLTGASKVHKGFPPSNRRLNSLTMLHSWRLTCVLSPSYTRTLQTLMLWNVTNTSARTSVP